MPTSCMRRPWPQSDAKPVVHLPDLQPPVQAGEPREANCCSSVFACKPEICHAH